MAEAKKGESGKMAFESQNGKEGLIIYLTLCRTRAGAWRAPCTAASGWR